MKRKAQVWISAVLYILITVVAIGILLQAGTPIITNLRDRTTFSKTKDAMLVLDKYIVDVSEGGPGSQKIVPISVSAGSIYAENNSLNWQIETSSKIMEPNARVDVGNVMIIGRSSSDLVSAYASPTACEYVLENTKIVVKMTQFGNYTKRLANGTIVSCKNNINTSQIIKSILLKETNSTASGTFTFRVTNDSSSSVGTGETVLLQEGSYLGSAVVRADVISQNGLYNYTLELSLDGNTDFLAVKLIKVKVSG